MLVIAMGRQNLLVTSGWEMGTHLWAANSLAVPFPATAKAKDVLLLASATCSWEKQRYMWAANKVAVQFPDVARTVDGKD